MTSIEDIIASTVSDYLSQQLQTSIEENKPKLKKFEDLTDEEVQQGIKDVIQSSTYSGSARDSLIQALNDSLCGKMTLTHAAAQHAIPFSTIHPYMRKLQIKLGIYDPNARKPRLSPKRKQEVTDDESVTPKKQRKKNSPLPGYIPFKQITIPNYWLQFPEKLNASVWDTVSNCNYNEKEKKQRLHQAILDVMIQKKTLKAAALDNTIPFTTVQTYFHRSRIALEQQMEADEEVQKAKPQSVAVELTSDEQPPTLECYAKLPDNSCELMDQAAAMLATLPPEQQAIFVQLMLRLKSQDVDVFSPVPANTSSKNPLIGNGINAMMNWQISQSILTPNFTALFQTPEPNSSPSSTNSPQSFSPSNGTNILEELAAMKPIKLEACGNIINDQPNITISECYDCDVLRP